MPTYTLLLLAGDSCPQQRVPQKETKPPCVRLQTPAPDTRHRHNHPHEHKAPANKHKAPAGPHGCFLLVGGCTCSACRRRRGGKAVPDCFYGMVYSLLDNGIKSCPEPSPQPAQHAAPPAPLHLFSPPLPFCLHAGAASCVTFFLENLCCVWPSSLRTCVVCGLRPREARSCAVCDLLPREPASCVAFFLENLRRV